MKKNTKRILLFVVILLVLVLFGVYYIDSNNSEKHKVKYSEREIKNLLIQEQHFLDAEHMHIEYIDVSEFKKEPLKIEWVTKTKHVIVKGKSLKGYVLEDDDNLETYFVSEDGNLYYKNSGYSLVKTSKKVSRIGLFYPLIGGADNCNGISRVVIEYPDGAHELTNNDGSITISNALVANDKFEIPVCYGLNVKFNNSYLFVNSNGRIGYGKTYLKDKVTNKELEVKMVIYIVVGETEKYYIVTTDDTLYMATEPEQYLKAIAKLDKIKIDKDLDSDIQLIYQDIILEFKDVRNDVMNR